MQIPGLEPVTGISGTVTLAKEMQKAGLDHPMAYVNDVLELIPGSKVVTVLDTGISTGARILVFPPYTMDCQYDENGKSISGCGCPIDYYGLLRTISRPADVSEDTTSLECDVNPLIPADTNGWF